MADTTRELDRLEERLNQQIARHKRSATISVVVGIIVILVLLIYFSWAVGQTKEALEPQGIATMASERITRQIPEARKALVKEAQTRAPQYVDDMITNAIDKQLPKLRTTAQDKIKTEVGKQFGTYEQQVKSAIDEAVDKHAENLEAMVAQLQTPEGTQQFEDTLFGTIDEAITDQTVQVELQSYGIALAEIDHMLMSLQEEGEFTNEEQRRLVRLLGILRELANRSELSNVDLSEE